MLKMNLDIETSRPLKVLCIGAHCDDIEIGCGGTLLKLFATYPNSFCYWVILCSTAERERECRNSAETFLAGVREREVAINHFRDGYLPFQGTDLKDYFESLKGDISPDIVFTHHRHDLHQDHRMVADLTWNTFRNHLILESEIPKYDGDLRSPNLFVELDESHCRQKIDHILAYYKTQKTRTWFDEDTFWALLRLRGLEAHSPTGLAEGFHVRKALL